MSKNNFPLYFETDGESHNPSIILISGLSGQLTYWPQSFVTGLVDQGFHVIRFDNRDVGLSKFYDELPTPDMAELINAQQNGTPIAPPYQLEDMAADAIALLDHLNIKKAHLVGTSMGGMIAQIIALDYPDRALSLTCIGSSSSDPTLPPVSDEVVHFISNNKRKSETMDDYLANKIRLHQIYNPHEKIDEDAMRTIFRKTYERSHNPAGFLRQMLAMVLAPSRSSRLTALQLPALIIHGTADPVFSREHGEQLAQLIPNATLNMIEKLGHSFPHRHITWLLDAISKMK